MRNWQGNSLTGRHRGARTNDGNVDIRVRDVCVRPSGKFYLRPSNGTIGGRAGLGLQVLNRLFAMDLHLIVRLIVVAIALGMFCPGAGLFWRRRKILTR
jgi:hypothetical protein